MSLHTIIKSSVKVKYWANRAKWIIYSSFKKMILVSDMTTPGTPFNVNLHPLTTRCAREVRVRLLQRERERVRGEREKMSRTWMFM